MKKIYGFTGEIEENKIATEITEKTPGDTKEPFRCIVKIRFPGVEKELSYYNDSFYLEVGDKVFVNGKLYGKLGVVTDVNTHFKINTADYKKVIGKPDTKIKGNFISINDKMMSFDTDLTAEKFAQMIIPPRDPDSDEDEGEIILGEGWSVGLEDFEMSQDVEHIKLERAVEYCCEGNVVFLSVKNGIGRAFVKGTKWYAVDFDFDGETVSNLYCDCPFTDSTLCKHELAVLITLRVITNLPQLENKKGFTAIDKTYFLQEILSDNSEISL